MKIWNLVFVAVLALGFAFAQRSSSQDRTQQPTQPEQTPQTQGRGSPASGQSSAPSSTEKGKPDVETTIQQAFQQDPQLADSTVSAYVSQDSVNLTGSVATIADRDKAIRIAEAHAGGRKVVDHIKVNADSIPTSPSHVPPR